MLGPSRRYLGMHAQPAFGIDQDHDQHDDHDDADGRVHGLFVEIDRDHGPDDGPEHGRDRVPDAAGRVQRAFASKGADADDVLHDDADPVGAVGHTGRQSKKDEHGQRDERTAPRQRVDDAGQDAGGDGERIDVPFDMGCGSGRIVNCVSAERMINGELIILNG